MIYELADTLTRVIDAVDVPAPPGIVITSAEIDFPLEITSARRGDTLVFFGSAPHSRWKSGFLPDVHLARLTIEIEEA